MEKKIFTDLGPELSVPYYIVQHSLNGNIYKKIYVVDIRNIDESKLFENFKLFQRLLLEDDYYSNNKREVINSYYPVLFELDFLYDSTKQNIPHCVLYDMEFAFKNGIVDCSQIVTRDIEFVERSRIIEYKDDPIYIHNFNLIYGRNGTGKTRLLNYLSSQLNIPVFYLNKDMESSEILSSTNDYFCNLSKILDYSEYNGKPVLLDDLCWNSLDDRNSILMLDKLYEFSHEYDVLITGSKEQTKGLVRKRCHFPHIINLNGRIIK